MVRRNTRANSADLAEPQASLFRLNAVILTRSGDFIMRKTLALLAAMGAVAGLTACGHTIEQKTASGALAGAVVGGPVGAAVGGAAGNVVGHATTPKHR